MRRAQLNMDASKKNPTACFHLQLYHLCTLPPPTALSSIIRSRSSCTTLAHFAPAAIGLSIFVLGHVWHSLLGVEDAQRACSEEHRDLLALPEFLHHIHRLCKRNLAHLGNVVGVQAQLPRRGGHVGFQRLCAKNFGFVVGSACAARMAQRPLWLSARMWATRWSMLASRRCHRTSCACGQSKQWTKQQQHPAGEQKGKGACA